MCGVLYKYLLPALILQSRASFGRDILHTGPLSLVSDAGGHSPTVLSAAPLGSMNDAISPSGLASTLPSSSIVNTDLQ